MGSQICGDEEEDENGRAVDVVICGEREERGARRPSWLLLRCYGSKKVEPEKIQKVKALTTDGRSTKLKNERNVNTIVCSYYCCFDSDRW